MDTKSFALLETLPPTVACIVWDVLHKRITSETIAMANKVSMDEWQKYEIVRCIAAANPLYPPIGEAYTLIEMMLETIENRVA